jgi:endonuclease/exonuclease/phosphatase family metal-dependent hydrolase
LRSQFPDHHLIAAGDYNQHRDGVGQYGSREVRELLSIALQDAGLSCVTEEDFVANGKLTRHSIDHVCMTSALVANLIHVDAWEGTLDGKRLSDHNGVLVSMNTKNTVSRVSVDCANPRN